MQEEQDSYLGLVEQMRPTRTPIPPPPQKNSRVPLLILAILGVVVLFIIAVIVAKVILSVLAVLFGIAILAGAAQGNK
ncbi:MAG: hypothetical protein WCD86_10165 [Ktedonobacteraceae bacterium]